METVQTAAMVFLTGMTLSGVVGSLLEMLSGQRLSFAPSFVDGKPAVLLVLSIVTAGPLMLFNDSLDAKRDRRIALPGMMCSLATSLVWIISLGAVLIEAAKTVW